MGTRSIVNIYEKADLLCTIYRQHDGYPTGMGKDILLALTGRQITNGYHGDGSGQFNGAGCLAAFLIGKLKDGNIGNVYMLKPGSTNQGEEFRYTIRVPGADKPIMLEIEDGEGYPIWNGILDHLKPDEVEKQWSDHLNSL